MSERTFDVVGTRPVRHDGVDKVTGRAAYGADANWPGMLHGALLRSPHAHARIVSIDTSAAEAMPGVKAVLVGAELPDTNASISLGEAAIELRDMSHSMLARTKVVYHGQAVAAVAATTLDIAKEAASKIVVTYDVLRPVLTVDEALAPGAPILHDDLVTKGAAIGPKTNTNLAARYEFKRGDLDAGFDAADVVVEREFRTPTVHQGYIEPHACIARCGEDGRAVVWATTQGPFVVRDASAAIAGLDPAHVKVVPSEIGGGFGGKIVVYLEPIALALSRKAHRPVKMVMTRDEVFRATGPTSGTKTHVKIGAKRDGTIVAAKVSLWYEAGAFRGSPVGAGAMCALAPYRIPNFFIEAHDVVVNKPKVAAYRAPGSPMAMFAVESVVDELARELKMDPIDLRLKNAVDEGDQAAYGPKFGPIGLKTLLRAAKTHPHWSAPLGPNQGRGFALGFWFNGGMNSAATVTLGADGSAAVVTGNPDIGGTRAAQAMMVAEELGIDVDRVRPSVGDTDTAGYTDVTGGSRVCFATGMAVINAAAEVREELKRRAAKIWNVSPDAVAWEKGRVIPPTGAKETKSGADAQPMSVAQVAAKMTHTGGPIVGRASLYAPMAGPGFGGHICDVEVDPETGRSRIVRYTALQDVGKAVHPSYVEGQMQGGAAQGIGWALNEEYVYNRDGVMENAGFLDYRMPVASDLPFIDTVIIEVANPLHPYGVRGVGEVPIVPPLGAVANAMRSATGVRFTQLPMSPPRVLEHIAAREAVAVGA
ncbi:MAG TPA: xanthine dehydrogenase family protein molybdopterin-binding subunit [Vicinamibacterales bacterium]|nr:xanthine dehydrogenase family protein molybdopterin-binding subunit [Vicinamibacterales bacterium]